VDNSDFKPGLTELVSLVRQSVYEKENCDSKPGHRAAAVPVYLVLFPLSQGNEVFRGIAPTMMTTNSTRVQAPAFFT